MLAVSGHWRAFATSEAGPYAKQFADVACTPCRDAWPELHGGGKASGLYAGPPSRAANRHWAGGGEDMGEANQRLGRNVVEIRHGRTPPIEGWQGPMMSGVDRARSRVGGRLSRVALREFV